jgi:hypothetical protein
MGSGDGLMRRNLKFQDVTPFLLRICLTKGIFVIGLEYENMYRF